MSEDLLKTYTDLSKFVAGLPGSGPPGGLISNYDHLQDTIDPRVEKELNAKEAMYIFDKYFITTVDRRKLIAAILNLKMIG